MKPPYRIEVFYLEAGWPLQWRWRIRSRNNQILATSEDYLSRRAARRTADRFGLKTGIPVVEVKR